MPLEVMKELPDHHSSAPPLLFVHGAWHGAWCWRNFLAFFAQHGFASHALSFRGHGLSTNDRSLRSTSIRHYVEDLAQVADALPSPPVVIGHSMGGFVVHRFLQQHAARGVVLLASVPPMGAWRATWHAARRQPLAFLKTNAHLSLYPLVSTVERAHDLLFSPATPRPHAAEHQAKLQDESYRAYLEMLLRPVRGKCTVRAPVLILNGAADAIIDQVDMRSTAAYYGCSAEVIPAVGHDMMLEVEWRTVAERILRWLQDRGLAPTARA